MINSMIYNGQEVQTWLHNGVEVYVSARPFYWIKDNEVQDGFLTEYASYNLSPNKDNFTPRLATLEIASGSSESNYTFTGETEVVNTQGNKYMEIVFYTVTDSTSQKAGLLNSFKVAGVEYKDQVTENAVITIDVSNLDTVSIYTNLTVWALGNWAQLYIKSIRFYS